MISHGLCPLWGTLTWLRILPGLFAQFTPSSHNTHLYRGFVNLVSLSRWRWVCTRAKTVIQIHSATVPLRYFFLSSSPLPLPLPFLSLFFFFFCFNSLHCLSELSGPSHILSAVSSPYSFLPLISWTQEQKSESFHWEFSPASDAPPFPRPDLGLIFSYPRGTPLCLRVDSCFPEETLGNRDQNDVCAWWGVPTFGLLITYLFSTSLIRMLIFDWLISTWFKNLLPLVYL